MDFMMGKLFFKDDADLESIARDPHEVASCANVEHGGDTNVGLEAGRYSGTSRPDLYLKPLESQSVFGPIGPVRHCGVFSDAQCVHLLIFPSASGEPRSPPVLLFGLDFPDSSEDVEAVVGALERLVRAPPPDNSSSATSSLCTKTIIKSISDLSLHGSLPMV
uniref:Uncharacterized protein n=1 Tax=Fagus sylvatica TaxID=28930 RepID=A0A2N9EYZ8_FAGSY